MLRPAGHPPYRHTDRVLIGRGLRRPPLLLGASPRRHVAARLLLRGPRVLSPAVPVPLPRLLRRRRRCHHPAPLSAWWRWRPRLRPTYLGRPPPLWPRLWRGFRRPPRRRRLLWQLRRAPHHPPARCRPLSRVPPTLGHDPVVATRVTMSDARRRTAVLGSVEEPPAHCAGARAAAATASVGVGGAVSATAGAAADRVSGGRAATAPRDTSACATATAPGVCPAARCSTWLSAPLVDRPSQIHLRSAHATSELPAAVVAELGLAPCRWCSRPYRAVRGPYGHYSLASHEAQRRLNPRGRRRCR